MYNSEKTKKTLSRQLFRQTGITCEQLDTMDDDEIQRYVEEKTGKQFGWVEGIKVKGISIISIENEAKKMEKRLRKKAR